MVAETLELGDPNQILSQQVDCIWVWLSHRAKPTPVKGASVMALDWEFQGAISRYITEPSNAGPTFIPAMRRKLPFTYLTLECGKSLDWAGFFRNSAGLKFEKVLFLCEEATQLENSEAFPDQAKFCRLPKLNLCRSRRPGPTSYHGLYLNQP